MARLNARGRANLNAIAAGFIADQAARWPGAATITIRALPSMAIRSAWAATADALHPVETADNWRELGDGSYLMTVERDGRREHAVVDVVDGAVIDREPIAEDQLPLLPELFALVGDGTPALPAEVVAVLPVTLGTDVAVE